MEDLVRRTTTSVGSGLLAPAAASSSTSTSSNSNSSVIHNNKSDRSTLLCFEASREGFLWLSRYVCFPFLLVLLMTSLASAWHYCFLPWRVFDYTLLLLLVAALHMLAAFLVYLLITTSRTSPGYVPLDWEPPSELVEGGQFVHPTNRDFSTTNWCSKCQSHRPRRSHHCRYCQRCVLVFDHHCPWVNNCVGWANMKYFLLLLFYATIYSGVICSSFLLRCYQVVWLEPEAVPTLTKMILVGLLMTWGAFGSGVASLGQAMILQVVYLTPSCEKAHLKQRIQQTLKMPRPERLAFLQKNIRLVFGNNPALWYLPTLPAGDPFSYAAFSDTIPPDNNNNNNNDGSSRREEHERQESLHALRYMREQQQQQGTHASSGDEREEEEEQRVGGVLLTTWKAKEATAGFDPALFYSSVGPRKGG